MDEYDLSNDISSSDYRWAVGAPLSTAQYTQMTRAEAGRFMADAEKQPVRTRLAELVDGRMVKDLGCGKGEEVNDLYEPGRYLGIDCSEELIQIAREKNPDYAFLTLPIQKAPRFLGVGIMKSVLEHLPVEEAVAVYEHARSITEVLFVAWHTEPGNRLKMETYQGELNEPMLQCKHERGLFRGVKRREVCGKHVIWEVR